MVPLRPDTLSMRNHTGHETESLSSQSDMNKFYAGWIFRLYRKGAKDVEEALTRYQIPANQLFCKVCSQNMKGPGEIRGHFASRSHFDELSRQQMQNHDDDDDDDEDYDEQIFIGPRHKVRLNHTDLTLTCEEQLQTFFSVYSV